MNTMPALHVAFYIPLKEAAKGTIGALVRLLPGVDAHMPPEVITPTAGPATNGTPQLSTLLTPRLSQRATHWLTHQHPPCFFQLQRNSLHQLWMHEALSQHYFTSPSHSLPPPLLPPRTFGWVIKSICDSYNNINNHFPCTLIIIVTIINILQDI